MNLKSPSYFTLINIFIAMIFMSFNLRADESLDLITNCTVALNKGDFTKAISISEALYNLEPTSSAGYLCKGRALGAQGKYDQALTALGLATKYATDSFDQMIAHTITGNLHKQFKHFATAINSYEKALAICVETQNDKFARINHVLIGETFALNKDLTAALKSFQEADKLANNDNERADGFEHLATTYSALGKHDQAIEYQLKAVQSHKKSGTLDQFAQASLQQGRLFSAAKEFANAEKAFTKLMQFAKDNGSAYFEAKAIDRKSVV